MPLLRLLFGTVAAVAKVIVFEMDELLNFFEANCLSSPPEPVLLAAPYTFIVDYDDLWN